MGVGGLGTAVNCTYRGHRQPVKQGPTRQLSTVHTEGTGNVPEWGKAGHRGHRQPDRPGTQTVGQTGPLSTVHTEDTGNQPGVGGGKLGRGHRHPVKQDVSALGHCLQ